MGEDTKLSRICRVCLEPRLVGTRSLHEKYKEYCIMEYINKLTSINIKRTDGLPDKICGNCFLELEVALSFIEKCENADQFLKNHHNSTVQMDIKVKTELGVPEIKPEENVDDEMCADELDDLQYLFVEGPEKGEENIQQVTSKSQVECHDCGNLFKSKCKLRVHWKQTHMLDALICSYCKRRFKSYKAMHKHFKNGSKSCLTARDPNVTIEGEGKQRVFSCKICKYKSHSIRTIEAHLRIHTGNKPFKCDLCHKSFTQQSSLQGHKEQSHKKYLVQITCQYCGKIVKGRNNVYRHLRLHREGIRPCPICEKPVSCRSLKQHMLRHTGVRTYTCETCAAGFYTSSELANHRRFVHTRSVFYHCELCDYKSIRKEKVTLHQSKHTGKNIPCSVCGTFSPSTEKALAHSRIHSADKPHECLQCFRKFMTRDAIRRHMLKKHSSMVENMSTAVKSERVQSKFEHVIIEIPKESPS